jgi:prophage antirepressor-like protein
MSDQALKCFDFDDKLIRVEIRNGDPWFYLIDICNIIGLKNPSMTALALDDDEKMSIKRNHPKFNLGSNDDDDEKGVCLTDTLGGQQEVLIVSESGLYTVILRSRAATTAGSPAHRFRKWVTAEVLPQIRKTGSYTQPDDGGNERIASTAEDRNKLDKVHYSLRIFGPSAARAVWRELGLIWVPEMEGIGKEKPTNDMLAAQFCETMLERRPGIMTPAQTIHTAYRDWCTQHGTIPLGDVMFGKIMTRLGYDKQKSSRIYYRDIALKSANMAGDGGL